jgi:hypothetical protein
LNRKAAGVPSGSEFLYQIKKKKIVIGMEEKKRRKRRIKPEETKRREKEKREKEKRKREERKREEKKEKRKRRKENGSGYSNTAHIGALALSITLHFSKIGLVIKMVG